MVSTCSRNCIASGEPAPGGATGVQRRHHRPASCIEERAVDFALVRAAFAGNNQRRGPHGGFTVEVFSP